MPVRGTTSNETRIVPADRGGRAHDHSVTEHRATPVPVDVKDGRKIAREHLPTVHAHFNSEREVFSRERPARRREYFMRPVKVLEGLTFSLIRCTVNSIDLVPGEHR
jgi:hypothetical protein